MDIKDISNLFFYLNKAKNRNLKILVYIENESLQIYSKNRYLHFILKLEIEYDSRNITPN